MRNIDPFEVRESLTCRVYEEGVQVGELTLLGCLRVLCCGALGTYTVSPSSIL